jgi:hypothetical protein
VFSLNEPVGRNAGSVAACCWLHPGQTFDF